VRTSNSGFGYSGRGNSANHHGPRPYGRLTAVRAACRDTPPRAAHTAAAARRTRDLPWELSAAPAGRSAPFTSDIITNSDFTITRLPRGAADAGVKLKVSGRSKELVWREVHGFGYKIHKEKVKKSGALVRPSLCTPAPPPPVLHPLPPSPLHPPPPRRRRPHSHTRPRTAARSCLSSLTANCPCVTHGCPPGLIGHALQKEGRPHVYVIPLNVNLILIRNSNTRAATGGASFSVCCALTERLSLGTGSRRPQGRMVFSTGPLYID
jgi:hypothetical protein